MKSLLQIPLSACVALLLAGPSALLAQEAVPAPALPDDAPVPEWQMQFENLERSQQIQYNQSLFEASRLFNQKRIIEALNEIFTAEAIFPNGPLILNLKGACYVEMRNFDAARANFEKAYDLQKIFLKDIDELSEEERRARMRPLVNIIFNLAEMDFVTHRWQAAHDRLESLLPDLEESNIAMSRLIEFKYLLCKLKIDQVEEARKLADKYDFLDDNPYYYYANAAIAYFDNDIESAERWRASARRVFRQAPILAPWEDTMIEFGYVKSFYGGDLLEE